MISFNKDLNLAIDFLSLLTDKKQKSGDLAEKLGTSAVNLRRITTKLSNAGLVITSMGKKGGFARRESDITLYEVLEALYGQPKSDIKKASGLIHDIYLACLKGIKMSMVVSSIIEEPPKEDTVEKVIDEVIEEVEEILPDDDLLNGW